VLSTRVFHALSVSDPPLVFAAFVSESTAALTVVPPPPPPPAPAAEPVRHTW
jgi:hypothetical protein